MKQLFLKYLLLCSISFFDYFHDVAIKIAFFLKNVLIIYTACGLIKENKRKKIDKYPYLGL